MTLIKWTPRARFLTPFDDFDRFFDSFLTGAWANTLFPDVDWVPAFDVIEKDNAYEVHVEAPRMKKSDFKVTVHDGLLTVSGEKKVEDSKEGKHYTHRESAYGRFSRSFRLPEDVVDDKNVKAAYKDGVLTITVPRTKPVEEKALEVKIS
ncbi:MAG: Hsp20/alpha crystallin family protein [Fidelibacterota bacterium]